MLPFTMIVMSKGPLGFGTLLIVMLLGTLVMAAPPATRPADTLMLSLPSLTWSVEVAAPGFLIDELELAPGGKAARVMASNKETGVIVSIFMEPAARAGDVKACREFYWSRAKQSPFRKEQIKQYEEGDMALVGYVVPGVIGPDSAQSNINAYLSQDGRWIDVHLSWTGPAGKGDAALQTVTRSIKINKASAPTARLLFEFGKNAYDRRQYKAAIVHFAKAVELEKQSRRLDSARWKVMLDLLGMSYGISGDIAKAKETLQWAITQEPEYPLFYYNMACACAETNDKAGTLANLKLMYRYKDNLLEGETLPSPKEDSSFEKLMQDKAFADEANKLAGS